MPEPKPTPASPKPKRKWWRRVLRGVFWTLLVLVVLHRPLILYGGPRIARMVARKQNLDASFRLSGTIFSNLTISDVKVTPIGSTPTPVKLIAIDKIRVDFSLWRLLRLGVGETLSSYEIHGANLQFFALPSKNRPKKSARKSIADTLRIILGQPATYSDRVLIDDLSIEITSKDAVTIVRNVHALFHPTQPGHLRIGHLEVPKLPVWDKLEAETSYTNRNLFLRNLRLGPDALIEELNFDASHRSEGYGSISLKSQLFGGTARLLLTGTETGGAGKHLEKQYVTQLSVGIDGVRVRDALAYFGVKNVPIDRLGKLTIDFGGDPEKPRTWKGQAELRVEGIAAGKMTIPEVTSTADFDSGTAAILTSVHIGGNTAELDAKIDLPEVIAGWIDAEGDATLQVRAADLPSLLSPFATARTSGSLNVDGKVSYRSRVATTDLAIAGKDVAFNNFVSSTLNAKLKGTKRIDTTIKNPLAGLRADLGLDATALRIGTFTIDTISADLGADHQTIIARNLSVVRGSNTVQARATATLPEDLKRTAELGQGSLNLAINAPALDEFGISQKGQILGGRIQTAADLKFAARKVDGTVKVTGGDFQLGEFRSGPLTGMIDLQGNVAQVSELSLIFNETDRIELRGRFDSATPSNYQGNLRIAFKDLAVLQPLLSVFGAKAPVRGALSVGWNGEGTLLDKKHSGEANLSLTSASYGELKLQSVTFGGRYTAESALADLKVDGGPTDLSTQIVWENQELKLREIDLRQGEQKVLSGEAGISLAKPEGQKFDPLRQPIRVSLQADQLDVEKLLSSLGKSAPASGRITLRLAAAGTPLRPELELTVQGRTLKAKATPQLDPADFDLRLAYQPGALTLDATARQPLIQPLTIRANAPLDLELVIAEKKLPGAMPITAEIKLPMSTIATLPKYVPQVRRIDGTVAIDVRVGGTVEKPELSGATIIALKNARLANENAPGIGQFDAKLVFARDTLAFERFRGEIGGGTFDLLGNIKLAKLTEPVFDLQLKAKEVLVKRDDSVTVRSDADIKVAGPMKAGSLTGEIVITQSRFFKEIDILPIGLPGRPKPAPKSAPMEPNISLPPPLDKWTIDLLIKTRPNDPFLIRGNLANGSVSLAIRVGNTGPQPWLEGAVTIDQFRASLPFSTLTMESGHVYFTQNAPLTPILDMQAQSKVRDYTVNAYIFGNAYQPQIQFTSEPPLPHADIVSLLATGYTTNDISANADVLASRAALIALQSLWKKAFKRGKASAPPPANANAGDNFLDRFEVELGGTDNQTGAREATAKFKVNDQIYILGELDTQGRYTGSLKYLLRFR